MPLSNDANKYWEGWLIDGLGGQELSFQKTLVTALEARQMPKIAINTGVVNMWWRKESNYIDVTSTLDGSVTATIHLQPYGTSLWIGRAAESYATANYYKRMAAAAFLETIDRCIVETTLTLVGQESIHKIEDTGKGK